MSGTKAGFKKARQTMIDRHHGGSEERYMEWMRAKGSKGGKTPTKTPKGFAANPELARTAGSLGGTISRRKPANKEIA